MSHFSRSFVLILPSSASRSMLICLGHAPIFIYRLVMSSSHGVCLVRFTCSVDLQAIVKWAEYYKVFIRKTETVQGLWISLWAEVPKKNVLDMLHCDTLGHLQGIVITTPLSSLIISLLDLELPLLITCCWLASNDHLVSPFYTDTFK